MEIKHIYIALLEGNNGQVDGLPANPRKWTQREVERIAASLQETPELLEARPLVVVPNGNKYVVLGGNLRLAGIKHNQGTTAPCAVLPEDTSAAKLKEIVIKDNSSFGEWDFDLLSAEWDDMPLDDWGVKLAIDEDEVLPDDDGTEVVEDEVPTEAEARVQYGDVWMLGKHVLMCGDSTKAEDVARLMDGEQADLWLTYPPYNVDYEGKTQDALKIANDSMSDGEFLNFLRAAFASAAAHIKEGGAFYVWHADSEGLNFRLALRESGLLHKQTLIWAKNSMVLGRQDYQWKHEPCLYGWKSGAGHRWYGDRKQTTVLEFDKPLKSTEHPTMKPLALFAYLCEQSSKAGDVVLDTFGGSGTTIMVCEQLNRKARVMEIDPHYCDIIIKRWEVATGGLAKKK